MIRQSVRFIPAILVALALATIGSTLILRNASAQQGGTQPGGSPPRGGQPGEAALGVAAQQQIRALLLEKQSRTPEERKIDSQFLYAMKAQRGEPMTMGGEVRTLRSVMEIL